MCIKSFIEGHKSIVLSLERIQDDTTFDGKQRYRFATIYKYKNNSLPLGTCFMKYLVAIRVLGSSCLTLSCNAHS